MLDVAFDEDSNRTLKGHSAANLAIIRHLALNLMKKEKTSKVGVKTKNGKIAWVEKENNRKLASSLVLKGTESFNLNLNLLKQ